VSGKLSPGRKTQGGGEKQKKQTNNRSSPFFASRHGALRKGGNGKPGDLPGPPRARRLLSRRPPPQTRGRERSTQNKTQSRKATRKKKTGEARRTHHPSSENATPPTERGRASKLLCGAPSRELEGGDRASPQNLSHEFVLDCGFDDHIFASDYKASLTGTHYWRPSCQQRRWEKRNPPHWRRGRPEHRVSAPPRQHLAGVVSA
jgi:hypothetical protein